MRDVLIKNGLIVSAEDVFPADLRIVNGVVDRIGSLEARPGTQVIDATDRYVMPGGVDAHTHLNLSVNGLKVSDGFYEGTAAAAVGGTTCVVEHPSFGPDGCPLTHQIEAYRQEATDACVVDFGIHGVYQLYIVHLSTAAGLAAIEAAQGRGLPVYTEVCPQHLLLEETCYQLYPSPEGGWQQEK